MFEKLLSQLPYNPSLIHQLGFYSRRMREEAAIRRTGVVLIVLAFLVQFFAVLSPPGVTSAATGEGNDLIKNGFSSAAQAAKDCAGNIEDYANILATYDISCKEVANAPTINDFEYNSHDGKLFSMGRIPYGKAGEQPVYMKDGTKLYVRYLDSWGNAHDKALRIIAGDGTTYWLLYGCGNLVSLGVPKTPGTATITFPTPPVSKPTPPKLQLIKTTLAGYPIENSNIAPNTTLGYRVYIDNTGGTEAKDISLNDALPANTSFVSQSLNAGAKVHTYNTASQAAQWQWATIPKDEAGTYFVDLVVKVDSNAPNGVKICNTASISASGLSPVTSNQVCMTVVVNAPPPVPTPIPTPTPTPTPPAPPTTPACLYDTSLPATSPQCKPCQSSTTTTDLLSCVAVSKTAVNQTQNIADANNTTAQPDDVIVYTLSAKNDANVAVNGYVFQENLSDVLVYADPVNLYGGTLDNSTGMVSWPAVNLAAGATATERVAVKVKDPVPAAVTSPADPAQYDLTMTNVYGNTVNIHVPAPAAQNIVTASAQLPNTGPGTGLFIFAVIMVISSYFYSRARLLARESGLAVKEASIG